MNTNKKSEINRYLARPAEKKPMDIISYINRMNAIYGNVEEIQKKTSTDQRTDSKQVKPDTKVIAKIEKNPKKEKWTYQSWADGLEERTRPKKKIIKIVKKPIKPLTPLDPLYDWRLAPWWEYPEDDDAKPKPEEDKTRAIRTGITKLI